MGGKSLGMVQTHYNFGLSSLGGKEIRKSFGKKILKKVWWVEFKFRGQVL